MEQRLTRLRQEQREAAPYRRIAGDWMSGVLILCDHAENLIPPGYGTLGLTPEDLARHIAYDIVAAGVAEHLARALQAPALLTRYSRLLIDPNRGLDDPTLVMQLSDGRAVPGMPAWIKRKSRRVSIAITRRTTTPAIGVLAIHP